MFRPFILSALIDLVRFKSVILLFAFCWVHLFLFPFPLFSFALYIVRIFFMVPFYLLSLLLYVIFYFTIWEVALAFAVCIFTWHIADAQQICIEWTHECPGAQAKGLLSSGCIRNGHQSCAVTVYSFPAFLFLFYAMLLWVLALVFLS